MEKQYGVKERLIEYLRYKKITQSEFSKSLGVSSTYVGAMRKGIPASRLKKISELYPDLNRDWLLYGEGEMLKKSSGLSLSAREEGYETLLLPVEAYAGRLEAYSRGVHRADCRPFMSPVSGVDFAIPVCGDSMEPRFHNGSILLVKRIDQKVFIPWGHPMVVDSDNGVLFKTLQPVGGVEDSEDKEYVVARSYNPDYADFKIPKSTIRGLYRVVGAVEMFT